MNKIKLKKLSQLIRYDILTSTTIAGSGHPTSSLSAVELLTTLFFAGFYKNHDRFILSKGHAAPLLYSLYHAGGLIDAKELQTLRKFGSRLEGHPTPRFPYVDIATGSLGQGLSVSVGMALGIKLRMKNEELKFKREPKVFVLLGDSEMAEGQVWEAMEIAAYYQLSNLIGIIDVNRLGQYGETEEGWKINHYAKKAEAFGWEPIIIKDGHNLEEIYKTFKKVLSATQFLSDESLTSASQASLKSEKIAFSSKPKLIIAKTIKGKGVSFLENKNGWHGKALNKEELKLALKELGKIDFKIRGKIEFSEYQKLNIKNQKYISKIKNILGKLDKFFIGGKKTKLPTEKNSRQNLPQIATREAYGDALVELGEKNPDIVVLDAEVANSTYENKFQKRFPERFFQMFIAEENMMSVALGLSKIGFIPFVSTFAAFLTQTFDQVRMAQYSNGNIKIVGSHAGVSIGEDGASQMGLEDIAMFRSILNSVVFYPSDAVSTKKLTKIMAENPGIFYMRTTRGKTPIIYDEDEEFEIGGIKVHKINKVDKEKILIITAGITLHEALKAQKKLAEENIETTVVDLYCIKPINIALIKHLIKVNHNIIVVEDHYPAGGIGETILSILSQLNKLDKIQIRSFTHLSVRKIPMSGTPEELLHYEEIDADAIYKAVKAL